MAAAEPMRQADDLHGMRWLAANMVKQANDDLRTLTASFDRYVRGGRRKFKCESYAMPLSSEQHAWVELERLEHWIQRAGDGLRFWLTLLPDLSEAEGAAVAEALIRQCEAIRARHTEGSCWT